MTMRIALDVDGVLADVMESWLVHNNKTRRPLSKEQLTDWDFWRHHGINKHDFYDEMSGCWRNWSTIPPTEKDLSGTTARLSEFGTVDIVTAREKSTSPFVQRWLEFHNISFNSYVSVVSGTLKADLDYDVYIDDSPLNAGTIIQHGKKILLYSQPWNLQFSDPRMIRISGISDAFDKIS